MVCEVRISYWAHERGTYNYINIFSPFILSQPPCTDLNHQRLGQRSTQWVVKHLLDLGTWWCRMSKFASSLLNQTLVAGLVEDPPTRCWCRGNPNRWKHSAQTRQGLERRYPSNGDDYSKNLKSQSVILFFNCPKPTGGLAWDRLVIPWLINWLSKRNESNQWTLHWFNIIEWQIDRQF